MNKDIQSSFDQLLQVSTDLAKQVKEKEVLDPQKLPCLKTKDPEKIIKKDLLHFFLYIGSSDGKLDKEEVNFINELFGSSYDEEELYDMVEEENIYSYEFEEKRPELLDLVAEIDMTLLATGNESGLLDTMKTMFESYGAFFLACDSNTDLQEIADLRTYKTMVEREAEKLKQQVAGKTIKDLAKAEYRDLVSVDKGDEKANDKKKPSKKSSKSQNDDHGDTEDIEDIEDTGDEVEEEIDDEPTLEELLEELKQLTGLEEVKQDVEDITALMQIRNIRKDRGLKVIPMSMHMVFSGNPGTGKTTVARLLAKIYNRLGVLSQGQLVEVDRSGLVGGYVGQTALKVQEVVNSALGGILFIDEAYALAIGGDSDYGKEAINTLLKCMEDHRDDLLVIVAGYPKLMDAFLGSNPGLRSRFTKTIFFKDYNSEELLDILKSMCKKNGLVLESEAADYLEKNFATICDTSKENFANGREVRNFFEHMMITQAKRLIKQEDATNEELSTFILDDILNTKA